MEIETVARRIVRKHNKEFSRNLTGGQLVFGIDGTGGSWHSDNAYGFEDCIVVGLRDDRPKLTIKEAIEIIDNQIN